MTFIMHFDRAGNPIDLLDWAMKMESQEYRYVAQEYIGQYFVSTLWFGLNWNWGPEPHGIFETMVFCKAGESDEWDDFQVRTDSIGEAAFTHIKVCYNLRAYAIKELTMNPNQVDIYETHSWGLQRAGNNRRGEPTYFAMCEKCLMTVPEARASTLTCEEVIKRESAKVLKPAD
jgi:hypothetical protein